MYIMKPSGKSCGQGIQIVGKETKVENRANFIISKYVDNPHLINGHKYDLRLYVLFTCFEPLKIFLFKEGLVRFATHKYSTDPELLEQNFVHLTNFSINRFNEDFVKPTGGEDADSAMKWTLYQLKQWYENNGINYNEVFSRIKDAIIKTSIAHEHGIAKGFA